MEMLHGKGSVEEWNMRCSMRKEKQSEAKKSKTATHAVVRAMVRTVPCM
jgi:hypothetical protein